MKNLVLILTFISLFFAGCTPKTKRLQESAQSYIDSQQYRLAINSIDKIVDQSMMDDTYFWALREGERISLHELKDFRKAIHYLDLTSADSTSFNEVLEAQKKKAEIYFDDFQNYSQAIIEYEKLTLILKDESEKADAFLQVARSHFYLNQFRNAEIIISTLLKMKLQPEQKFYAYQLLANIKLATKDFKSAQEIFLNLLKTDETKAISENIFLSLALVYEENHQLDKAIDILKEYRDKYSPQEYIDLRIKRLQVRKKNQPGAKGFKK